MSGRGTLRVIGLLSGTSMDGIDAALVQLSGSGPGLRASLRAFRTFAYPKRDRLRLERIAGRGETEAVERARLDVRLGELFARAALRLAGDADRLDQIDLIGSHGQTILHFPAGREGASVQIGDGPTIAARTGVPTIHHFRGADRAAGGEGAPLLPIADYLLFRSPDRDRILLNLGGIANLTWLPAGGGWEETVAYDTGPGNALIDRVVSLASSGRKSYDRGGAWAAKGRVDPDLLKSLMSHPFLRRRPPRSTGTEEFGDDLTRVLWDRVRRRKRPPEDLLATVTAFTAAAAGREIRKLAKGPSEVYVCGGGAHNRFLLHLLEQEIGSADLLPFQRLGFPPDAREAVGFAVLAAEFVTANRYPMRRVTGARGEAPLGVFAPGPRPYRLSLSERG